MPALDGMQVLAKIKTHQTLRLTPVIIQTARASQQDVIEGMNAGAYYYLTKPFDHHMLQSIVRAAIEDKLRYDFLKAELEQSVRGLNLLQNAYFEFSHIDDANSLAKVLANACAQPGKVVTGISELLMNAVEHGNLNIGYDDKSRLISCGLWSQEINKRMQQMIYKDKKVRVTFKRDKQSIRILIKDEGNGFDWAHYL